MTLTLPRPFAWLLALLLLLTTPAAALAAGPTPTADGPRLLYRTHVDAAHMAYENGGLAIKVVAGETPVPADSVVVRLGPDAGRDGRESSRIQLTPDAPELAFLGKPGDVVWTAPQTDPGSWAPVWPGFGAGAFPVDVVDAMFRESLTLHLVSVEGPGAVEVYRHEPLKHAAQRLFSSTDARFRSRAMPPGSHGHMSWSFSRPGTYTLTWQSTMTLRNGKVVSSAPTPVTWKVGPDAAVGLPEGATARSPITSFTGNAVPDGFVPRDGDVLPVGAPTRVDGTWPSATVPDPLAGPAPSTTACTHVTDQQLRLTGAWDGSFDGEGWPSTPKLVATVDGTAVPARRISLELPDARLQTVPDLAVMNRTFAPGTKAWALPADRLLQLAVAEGTDFAALREASMSFAFLDAPAGADMAVTGSNQFGPVLQSVASDTLASRPVRFYAPQTQAQTLWFNRPGYYQVEVAFTVEGSKRTTDAQIAQNYTTATLNVAVGDAAVARTCERGAGVPTPTTSPSPTATAPTPSTPTTPTIPSTPLPTTPLPTTAPTSTAPAPVPTEATPTTTPKPGAVTLDHGHVDAFRLSLAGEKLVLDLREDVTGSHVVRAPEDVVLRVKPQALTDIPAGYPGAPRAYLLPLSQDPALLWPGWDTNGLPTGSTAKIKVEALQGPGPVGLFSEGFGGALEHLLEAGDTLPGTIVVPGPTHVHAYWAFPAPGTYRFRVTGTATVGGKQLTSAPAVYTFVVGDAAPEPAPTDTSTPTPTPSATASPAPSPTATASPAPTISPAPTPGRSPSPTPTRPATPAPAPDPVPEKLALDHGHVDLFNLDARDGKPVLDVSEDVTGEHVRHDPEDLVLRVKPSALMTVPKIGLPIDGKPAYVLPETQDTAKDLVWPGWNTLAAQGSYGATTFHVESVTGPGEVYLTRAAGLGGQQRGALTRGARLPGDISVPSNAHVHASWFFTKPGTYTLKVSASTTPVTSGRSGIAMPLAAGAVRTAVRTYTIEVGTSGSSAGAGAPGSSQPGGGDTAGSSQPGGGDTAGSAGTSTSSASGTTSGTTGASPDPSRGARGHGKASTEECRPVRVPGTVGKAPAAEATASAASVGADGHFDIGTQIVDGALVPSVKDDRRQPPTWRAPEQVVFSLGAKAKKQAPAGMEFIAKAGTDVYVVGSTQEAGLPWIGQNTMHESVVSQTTGAVTWHLDGVDGPGKVAVFNAGALGGGVGTRVFDNVGGPTSYTVPANTHSHPNWVFSAPGRYVLSITQTATLKSGAKVSGKARLVFAVGEGTSTAAVVPAASGNASPAPTLAASSASPRVVGRTADGRECQLTPEQVRMATTGAPEGVPSALMAAAFSLLVGAGLLRRGRAR